jgi:hypothetical protein
MANYTDLNPAGIPNKDYFDIVVSDLNVNTDYNFQFRWQYQDKTYGEWSATKLIKTQAESTPGKPLFVSGELTSGTGFIRINWSGNDTTGTPMTGLKQVNVWIRGGSFGATSIKTAHFFTSPGVKTIPVPFGEYYVKLQAETILGTLSPFSDEQSIWVLKKPQEVTSVSGTWVKDDGTSKTDALKISFTFNPSLETTSNTNVNADYFLINLTANGKTKTFYAPVNKASSSQEYYLSASENKANFGLFSSQFTISIQVRDTFGQTSDVVTQQSLTYTTPLDVPVISATEETLSYSVTWNQQTGKPLDQIYVYEDTGTGYVQVAQGSGNPIRVPTTNTLQRSVKAKFYDSNGFDTSFSNIVTVTPNAAVTIDGTGPANVTTVTTSGGLDSSGTIGFNGYADISWNSVTGGGIRGYRIRFRPVTNPVSNYSYADSPGSGTAYRLTGLGAGLTYEIAVATYDEYNNTSSSYISGTNVAVGGTPYIASTVDVTGFFRAKANSGDADSTAFKFGYGVDTGKRGLVFNANNYWYIDSNQSASLKVGGSTTNYIQWDGAKFTIDGNLQAKQGTFSGNVQLASGASVYSGTLTGETSETSVVNGVTITTRKSGGSLSGAGYILNSSGLTFNSSTIPNITTIDASNGKLSTSSATIGGWDVNASTISKNGISLNSSGTIVANNGAYYVGIKPQSAAPTDIVLWAGQSSDGSSANFRVEAGGKLWASGATLTGDIDITSGSTFNKINAKAVVFRQDAVPTALAKGDIWIDTNDSNKMYVATGAGTNLTTDNPVGVWALSQDSAAAAFAASQAAQSAATANLRAQKFDSVTGDMISGVSVTTTGNIYGNKSSYASDTTGWFLGWRSLGAGNFTPALNIGGSTSYIKWDGSALSIKGPIVATSFESTNSSAGNGISITSQTVSGGTYDQIEFSAGGTQKLRFSANASGAVIWGPSSNSNISMPNGSSIQIVANGFAGATVTFASTGAVVNGVGYSATDKSFRNIIASTTTLSDGATATGYLVGDIYLVY